MSTYKKRYCNMGEHLAVLYLREIGYAILATNYRSRYGEIDVIARHEETTVFVEVKRRKSLSHGHPVEAVHYHKQRHIIQTAYRYANAHGLMESSMRFDVIELVDETVHHIINAFEVPTDFEGL